MKKFDRLPPEQRKQEIAEAAKLLFLQKGFRATTMENIVSQVTLSKGGVYRLYGSTEEILMDLILEGMRLRNQYYMTRVGQLQGKKPETEDIISMIWDSLLIHEDVSRLYVEFLWEKQHSEKLEALYEEICRVSIQETSEMIRACGAGELLLSDPQKLQDLTDLMNGAILSIRVLNLDGRESREKLTKIMMDILS